MSTLHLPLKSFFFPTDEVPPDEDLLELKRGNLLLEREKLNLEIQFLQAKMERFNQGNV